MKFIPQYNRVYTNISGSPIADFFGVWTTASNHSNGWKLWFTKKSAIGEPDV